MQSFVKFLFLVKTIFSGYKHTQITYDGGSYTITTKDQIYATLLIRLCDIVALQVSILHIKVWEKQIEIKKILILLNRSLIRKFWKYFKISIL